MMAGALRCMVLAAAVAMVTAIGAVAARAEKKTPAVEFRTSDRCVACHNGLLTASGDDVSIGFDWRASIMANSSRDPYWQGSVRREAIDHPESKAAIAIEIDGKVAHQILEALAHPRADGSDPKVLQNFRAVSLAIRDSSRTPDVFERDFAAAFKSENQPAVLISGRSGITRTAGRCS